MTVLYSVDAGIATLTLNRPDSRNALNLEMCNRLIEAANSASADASVKIFFVRANGPVFCAGADLKEREGMNEAQVRERRGTTPLTHTVRRSLQAVTGPPVRFY